MKFGLDDKVAQQIAKVLSKYHSVNKAIVYGSRAMGTHRPNSDIDLALIGEDLDFGSLSLLEADLDDLLLPFKIDLSALHKIENPDLLAHINLIGKVFYQQNTPQTIVLP